MGPHHHDRGPSRREAAPAGRDLAAPAARKPYGGAPARDPLHRHVEEVRGADEPRHEGRRRRIVDLFRRAHLFEAPATHHRDAIGHGERLFLIVGHEDERDPDLALDALQLALHMTAQRQVERGEGLVQQERARLVDEGARERDTLALAAGELARTAAGEIAEPHDVEHLPHPPPELAAFHAADARAEGNVVEHREVREERVVLEDRVDGAAVGRHAADVDAVEPQHARRRGLEAGDHAQHGGLAAARGTEHREELATAHREGDAVDGDDVAEALAHPLDGDDRRVGVRPPHVTPPPAAVAASPASGDSGSKPLSRLA
jgi:hypothetical protein